MAGMENLPAGLKFFQGVNKDTLDRLWRAGKVETFEKGRALIRAKEPVESVYVQVTGKSMVYNLTHTGKRKIIFIFGPGVLLNEHVQNSHDASLYCETIEKSRIFVVPAADVMYWMERDFSLTRAVLTAQEQKIWRMGHQLKNTMGSIYLERKLAAKLWKLGRDFGIPVEQGIEIDISLPVSFLADMLGAPRETTSRVCKTLAGYGLIRMDRKRITILNSQKMAIFYKTGKTG